MSIRYSFSWRKARWCSRRPPTSRDRTARGTGRRGRLPAPCWTTTEGLALAEAAGTDWNVVAEVIGLALEMGARLNVPLATGAAGRRIYAMARI